MPDVDSAASEPNALRQSNDERSLAGQVEQLKCNVTIPWWLPLQKLIARRLFDPSFGQSIFPDRILYQVPSDTVCILLFCNEMLLACERPLCTMSGRSITAHCANERFARPTTDNRKSIVMESP